MVRPLFSRAADGCIAGSCFSSKQQLGLKAAQMRTMYPTWLTCCKLLMKPRAAAL